MIDQHQADLVHRFIDGEITAEEQAELDDCLATSPATRIFYERMLLLRQLGEERGDVARVAMALPYTPILRDRYRIPTTPEQ